MFLSPIKNITYKSGLPLEEVYSNLTDDIYHIAKPSIIKLYFKSIFSTNHNKYMGLVNYNSFKIVRTTGSKYKTIITGSLNSNGEHGSLIKVKFHKWFNILAVLFINFFLLSFLIIPSLKGDFSPWLVLFFLIALLVANIIPYRLFQYEVAIFERFLEKTIQATRVSKKDAS